jgi:maleylpyruvate isomerase
MNDIPVSQGSRNLAWMAQGYDFFLAQLKLNDDARLHGPSRLPGWTGRHLLSHVGHNAQALGRLAHWARTGEPTPMYPSPDARVREIDAGAAWPVNRLREFVEEEQERLSAALDGFTEATWNAEVVTAQGRTVPASTIPWLRAREAWIHACDLPTAADFVQMPADFLDALITDAVTRRTAQGVDAADLNVTGDAATADVARWLTGRATQSPTGAPLPTLPLWL